MNILRALAKGFGSFLIFLALLIIFTELFIDYGLKNTDVILESAETVIPEVLEENKELFAEALFKEKSINKAQLKSACKEDPDELSADFCSRLDTMTEEEAKEELVDILILKTQEELEPELQEFEQDIEIKLEEAKITTYINYIIPLGIIIFMLGSLLIFIGKKFKWKAALTSISFKTGIISGFAAVTNYFTKNLNPSNFEKIAKSLPMISGEEEGPGLAFKLMSELLTEWIRTVSAKLFFISATIATVSLTIAVTMFILKRKKKIKKEKPKEEIKEEPKKVEEKEQPKEIKKPKIKKSIKKPTPKKRAKKVLYSKKK